MLLADLGGLESPVKQQQPRSWMNKMARPRISEQDWETFLKVADDLGIDVRGLLKRDVPFREMEAAGHRLGQAIARVDDGTPVTCPGRTLDRSAALSDLSAVVSARAPRAGSHHRRWGDPASLSRCATARRVVEIFFPQRPDLGLEQSEYSPTVIDKIVSANAEQKSAYQA